MSSTTWARELFSAANDGIGSGFPSFRDADRWSVKQAQLQCYRQKTKIEREGEIQLTDADPLAVGFLSTNKTELMHARSPSMSGSRLR